MLNVALTLQKLYCPKCGTEAMLPSQPSKPSEHPAYAEWISKPIELQCVQTYCKAWFWGVAARPALTRQEGQEIEAVLKRRIEEEDRKKKDQAVGVA